MADMMRAAKCGDTYIVLTHVRDGYWVVETFDTRMTLLESKRYGSEAEAIKDYERPLAVAAAEQALHDKPNSTKELKR